MKPPHTTTTIRRLAAWLAIGILGVMPVRAGLLAFDSFEDYDTATNIHGQTGGTGWSGAWAVQNISGGGSGVSMVSSEEITYNHGGVMLGGGKSLLLSNTSNGTRRDVFATPNTGGSDHYVSFVFRFSGTVFTGWQALDGSPDIINDSIGLVNTNGAVGARVDNTTVSTAAGFVSPDTTGLMVIQYTGWTGTNYSTVNVWINPAPVGQSGNTPSATYTDTTPGDGGGSAGFLGVYVRTLIGSGESFLIDDLRVGTDWESVAQIGSGSVEADWYLINDQPVNISWTNLSDWNAAADGTGAAPASIAGTDTFDVNNHFLRGPSGTGTYVFDGAELWLTGTSGTLALKTHSGGTSEFARVIGRGGRVLNYQSGVQNVRFTHFDNESGVRFSSGSGKGLRLHSDVMLGAGETRVIDAGVFQPDVDDATDYVGDVVVQSGSVGFVVPFTTGGRVVIEKGGTGKVSLDADVSANGFVVKGESLAEGTHTFTSLQGLYPTVFTSGLSSASVTVRAPTVWHLDGDQPSGHDWATLGDWNSQADGLGDTPAIMNPYDIYSVVGSNWRVRTPATAATFPGAVLAVGSGAQLLLETPAGQVSTVPGFATAGTVTINSGVGGAVQTMAVGDWQIDAGTTKLDIGSTNGLNLTMDRLSGPGTLRTQNGGAFTLGWEDGRGFTGTLHHYSGSLTLGGRIFGEGSFVVNSATSVLLDGHAGYFPAITVGGTSLTTGIHSRAALHAAFPSQFPETSGEGFLAVYAPDTTGPAHMFGVNLAGAEFTKSDKSKFPGTYGSEWIYPTAAEFDYYHGKGLDLIRIPFRWERMQASLGGALDPAELGRMDTVVGYAAARGMKVVLDMHNYARWVPGPYHDGHLIGTGPVTIEHFAEVWSLLADHYKGNATIYGYGIMNEPHGTNGTWPAMAQAAVDAIRAVDLGTYVIVGGDSYSNAYGWRAKNPNLDIKDPTGRLIYEAHCYFDANNSGRYEQSYDDAGGHAMLGVERVTEFVEWLQEKGVKGFIGEYGVPNDDPDWLVVLDNFLSYLDDNGVSGTYWAGGPWWGNYRLSCEPTNNFTVDKPQMSVLEDY
ncbi:MAG: glycoside hydrolase family 5 protein [Verrucomicrobiota bacterium]